MRGRGTVWPLLAAVAVLGCFDTSPAPVPPATGPAAQAAMPAPEPDYLDEVESWRAERMAGLRKTDGWLSLVGLFWLAEDGNTVGADPASDLVFPAGKSEPRLGVLRRSGRQVSFTAAPGADVRSAGEPVTSLDLVSDAGGKPTTLEHGSLSFYVIERGERVGIRLKDRDSELLRGFTGIDHYPVDPAWRLAARFEPFAEPKMIPVPNITGDVLDQPSPGRIVFSIAGAEHSLEPLGEPGGRAVPGLW